MSTLSVDTTNVTNPETIGWAVSRRPVDYPFACAAMEDRARRIAAGDASELIWLLEHPPLYTAGTSARPEDLLEPERFPVYAAGRGGQYTYHGPGQRVVYTMLDLRRRGGDVRAFVQGLEAWVISTLAAFGVTGDVRPSRIGVWVARDTTGGPIEEKIAAIGIRVRHWVTFHGLSLNVAPNLDHFHGIVPCGISEHGVTSLAALGRTATMTDVDRALKETFHATVGGAPLATEAPPDDVTAPIAVSPTVR